MARKELLDSVLTKFAKFVIQQSRTNLTKGKHNFDKTLYNSLSYNLSVGENSFSLSFDMEDYGEFQDKGVKGAGGTRKTTSAFNRRNNKGKIWKQKKVLKMKVHKIHLFLAHQIDKQKLKHKITTGNQNTIEL